jgi:hypothetical protein
MHLVVGLVFCLEVMVGLEGVVVVVVVVVVVGLWGWFLRVFRLMQARVQEEVMVE